MYGTFDEFKRDALACGKDYYPDSSLDSNKVEVAYHIYKRTSHGTQLFDFDGNPVAFGLTIVGRLALRKKVVNESGQVEYVWEPSNPEFPSIDAIMKQNFGTVDENKEVTGVILDSSNWTLLANDAWLLGGLHALTEFHFASPLRWENLWDPEQQRMTVTAREVIGILGHSFEILRPNPKLEAVAVCENDVNARNANLLTYKARVDEYKQEAGLKRFFASLPEEATAY
jgi:hypothetical protein